MTASNKKRVTILGGGFGLYGYLPALLSLDTAYEVVLPQRYRSSVIARPELKDLDAQIIWDVDNGNVLSGVNAVIFAKPPQFQEREIFPVLAHENIERVLLEKPLSCTPSAARGAFQALCENKKFFRIGYNFRLIPWAKGFFGEGVRITGVVWDFQAHHYKNNINTWKRHHDQGGGAIRFFGIHLIALLAESGYDSVVHSNAAYDSLGDIERWDAVFSKNGGLECSVVVNSNAGKSRFLVYYSDGTVSEFSGPFEDDQREGMQDIRVYYLKKLLVDFFSSQDLHYGWYSDAIALWQAVEDATVFR